MRERWKKAGIRSEAGLGLFETLVAVAVLGTSVAAFLSGLSAGSLAVREQNRIFSTQELAQSQMEYTKSYPYNSGAVTYPSLMAPDGYSISVSVNDVPGTDANIQKITVTVTHEVTETTLNGYKVNR